MSQLRVSLISYLEQVSLPFSLFIYLLLIETDQVRVHIEPILLHNLRVTHKWDLRPHVFNLTHRTFYQRVHFYVNIGLDIH